MTQDLTDLCLIDKDTLRDIDMVYVWALESARFEMHRDRASQESVVAVNTKAEAVLAKIEKALAQDLSGMRLVAPPPQTDDELFKSPWYEFARDAYYDMGNGYAHPRVHAAFARQIFWELPAAPGLETEEPKA